MRSFHRLRTRKAGSNRFIDFHLAVDDRMSVGEAHALGDEIVVAIKERLPDSRVHIHVEPCAYQCPDTVRGRLLRADRRTQARPSRRRTLMSGSRRLTTGARGARLIEAALRGRRRSARRGTRASSSSPPTASPCRGAPPCASADEAVRPGRRASAIPVVMKGSSASVQHKTDAGLVLLGVADETEVREGYRTLEARAAAAGVTLDGVLVEHMVQGKREFVVGLIRDQLFGPVVMFGLGGIFTEALHDVAFAVAPLSEEDVDELLDAIEAKVLLGPFRGSPAGRPGGAWPRSSRRWRRWRRTIPRSGRSTSTRCSSTAPQPVAVDALIAVGEPVEVSTRPPADLSRLDALVAPRSVVVVGASADTGKWGGMLVANLRLGGFPGPSIW